LKTVNGGRETTVNAKRGKGVGGLDVNLCLQVFSSLVMKFFEKRRKQMKRPPATDVEEREEMNLTWQRGRPWNGKHHSPTGLSSEKGGGKVRYMGSWRNKE